MPDLAKWTTQLECVAQKPLEYCADFPRIAKRFEAWWVQECLDRPILIGSANRNPARPITRRLELLNDPGAWFDAKRADMMQTHNVGDALPHIRVDFGPVLLGSFFGGEREFGGDTAWTHPFIQDDWSNEPDWRLDENNPWWKLLNELLHVTAIDAGGRYLVCSPDLGGSADILLNLRGATPLCMDTITQSAKIKNASDAMYTVWQKTFETLYEATVDAHGAGLIHWFGLWSSRPYHAPACDFNFMIAPKEFQELCLLDIAKQSAAAGRACFHLDGPQAANHIDSLLEVEHIQAIQFTPGAQDPSALAWVDMFRKIQDKGRSVLVFCPTDEVLDLCDALKPEGLAIMLDNPPPVKELNELYEALCRRFACPAYS